MADGEEKTFRRKAFTPVASGGRAYDVVVFTSAHPNASSAASRPQHEVFITLYGSGDPPRRTLRHQLHRSALNTVPFRPGQADSFLIETDKDIGPLSGVRLGIQTTGASWHCHHVEVRDVFRKQWTYFMCREPLGEEAPSRRVLRPGRNAPPGVAPSASGETHSYKVSIVTANERGAGLGDTAEVEIMLLGLEKASGPLPLAPHPGGLPIMQRGDVNLFVYDLPYLGEISRVEVTPIKPGAEGAWHLKKIEVTKLDGGTSKTQSFEFDSNIPAPGRPMGQGYLLRPGDSAADPPGSDSDWKYEVAVFTACNSSQPVDAEVVIGLWGSKTENGPAARRRLLHPCWVSNWAPVLHQTQSYALRPDLSRDRDRTPMETATGHSSARQHRGAATPTRKSVAAKASVTALPVDIRRSVAPSKRDRSKPPPKREMPGVKRQVVKKAVKDVKEPEDPIEALRFHGLLDGMESLFEDSVPQSVLSSGLGEEANGLTCLRHSCCHTWLDGTSADTAGQRTAQQSQSCVATQSGVHKGEKGHRRFSPGSCMVFLVDAEGLGDLTRVSIEMQGGDAAHLAGPTSSWIIDRIEVWDRDTDAVTNFAAGPGGRAVHPIDGVTLSAGRPVTTYEVVIHTGASGATDAVVTFSLLHQGLPGSSPYPLPLAMHRGKKHSFESQSCERFLVTLPDCGDAPDSVCLNCKSMLGEEWDVLAVELRKAGSSDYFRYPNDGGPMKPSDEQTLQIPVEPIAGLTGGAAGDLGQYKVTVQTSNIRGAGTEANVWVVLYGKDANGDDLMSNTLKLDNSAVLAMMSALDSLQSSIWEDVGILRDQLASPKEWFERGKVDHFLINSQVISNITHLLIWTDSTGAEPLWHVHQVEVQLLSAPERQRPFCFPIEDWLATTPPPASVPEDAQACAAWAFPKAGSPLPPCPPAMPCSWKYRIEVYTSNIPLGGTDVEVYVTLKGMRGQSGPHELGSLLLLDATGYEDPSKPDLFEPGQVDVFVVDGPDLGPLTSVTIGHYGRDCNAAWHLDQVVVVDQFPIMRDSSGRRLNTSARPRYHFLCDRWLAKNMGAGETMVELAMSRPALHKSVATGSTAMSPSRAYVEAHSSKKGVYFPGITISPISTDDVVGPGGERWRHSGSAIRPSPTDVVKGRSALRLSQQVGADLEMAQPDRVLMAERQAKAVERACLGYGAHTGEGFKTHLSNAWFMSMLVLHIGTSLPVWHIMF